jgi:hypothetical protein
VAEVAVEPVVGVLAHRAGVEHDQVGHRAVVRGRVPGVLEQAGQPLGVVTFIWQPYVRTWYVRGIDAEEAEGFIRSGV